MDSQRIKATCWVLGKSKDVGSALASSTAHALSLVAGVVTRTTDASESLGLCAWLWEGFALIRVAWKAWVGPSYRGSGV